MLGFRKLIHRRPQIPNIDSQIMSTLGSDLGLVLLVIMDK